MREIIALKAENREFIGERTHGFGEFSAFLAEFETNTLCRTAGVSAPSVREAASLLSENNPRIIAVYDFGSRKDRAAGDLQALADFLLLTGNLGSRGRGLIIMDKHANSTGLCDMGAEPGYKTGRIRDDAEPHNIREMLLSGRIKGALVIGEDPLENPANLRFFRGLEFLAVADIFMTETTSAANVIMPASTHIESGGSFTGSDRRVRRFESACNPPGRKTNLEIINDLAEGLGKNIGFRTPDEAFEAIMKTNALYRNINPDKPEQAFWNPDPEALIPEILYSRRFETPDGKARFSPFPLESGFFSADIFNYNAIESVFSRRIKKLLTTSKPPS
jgi:formate dehydrogenase major subunit